MANKNEAINSPNDTQDDQNECSPPQRKHPSEIHHDHPTVPGTQHSESRYKDTDNGYNKDNNTYNQSYAKNPNLSQHQSQSMQPSYGNLRNQGRRSNNFRL